MKTGMNKKKLFLNKVSIARLEDERLSQLKGKQDLTTDCPDTVAQNLTCKEPTCGNDSIKNICGVNFAPMDTTGDNG